MEEVKEEDMEVHLNTVEVNKVATHINNNQGSIIKEDHLRDTSRINTNNLHLTSSSSMVLPMDSHHLTSNTVEGQVMVNHPMGILIPNNHKIQVAVVNIMDSQVITLVQPVPKLSPLR
jgi:hypothetical protein